MPSKYFCEEKDEESCYESEGGTEYYSTVLLGEGRYSRARIFQSLDGLKEKAVLDPQIRDAIEIEEVNTKFHFFKTIYPDTTVELYSDEQTYRLVLPLIPGIPYKNVHTETKKQQIDLFISAIDALQDCHDKGCVVVDLKSDNILYDTNTGKSYLIDGGLAAMENIEVVEPIAFCQKTMNDVVTKRLNYFHIAPECWSTSTVIAKRSMDIYSLGVMMERKIENPGPALISLIKLCRDRDPKKRPTLDNLKKQLIELNQQLHDNFKAKYPRSHSVRTLKKVNQINQIEESVVNCTKSSNDLMETQANQSQVMERNVSRGKKECQHTIKLNKKNLFKDLVVMEKVPKKAKNGFFAFNETSKHRPEKTTKVVKL